MLCVAVISLGFWCLAWTVHVIIWRVSLPANQFLGLVRVFGAVLPVAVGITWIFCDRMFLPRLLLVETSACYIFLTLSYISFYSLIEGESPSVSLVMECHARSCDGLPAAEVFSRFETGEILEIRLRELERDGLVRRSQGSCSLTFSGRFWAKLFAAGRRLTGLPCGG